MNRYEALLVLNTQGKDDTVKDVVDRLESEAGWDWNQRQLWMWQFTVNDMKIGAAHCACRNSHEQLSPRRRGFRHPAQLQRLSWLLENHGAHCL